MSNGEPYGTDKKPLTFEEKAAQIKEAVVKQEGEVVTELEEWSVLNGKGVEFIFDTGVKIIIPPSKLKHLELMIQMDKKILECEAKSDILGVYLAKLETIASITKIDLELLKENCDRVDADNIIGIMMYNWYASKNLFNKKKITKLEVLQILTQSISRKAAQH